MHSFSMMRMVAFFSRLLVYGIITAVGFAVIPTEDMLVDRNLRLSISALQVGVLTAAWLVHFVFTHILRIIKQTTPISFVRLDAHAVNPYNDVESHGNNLHTDTHKFRDNVRKDESRDDSAPDDGVPQNDAAPHERITEDYNDQHEVMSVSDSVSSTTSARRQVVFDNQASLNNYVIYIHIVGLALWQTFLCFDCTSRDIDIAFICGLIMGWVFVSAKNSTFLRMACVACYAVLVCTMVLSEEHIFKSVMPAEDYLSTQGMFQLYFNICILPFATGMFWVLAAYDPQHQIVMDTQRSVITFLLISLTFPLYWSRVDIRLVQNFFVKLPHLSIMCIMILSPIFKCISIYVMLVSLHKRQTLDLVLSLATVLCVSSIVLYEIDTIMVVRVCVAAVLLTFHFIMINCNGRFDIR